MTNIQAIDLLRGLEQSLDDYCELNDEGKTAFRMAITALELFGNAEQLPSAQPERWDTCFSCPLSHGCPVIKGCTNDQAEQYAGEIPTDCPLDKESAQPEIVRCKDCKYRMPYDWMFSEVWQSQNMDDYQDNEIGCQYCDMSMTADDFCSRAERREE